MFQTKKILIVFTLLSITQSVHSAAATKEAVKNIISALARTAGNPLLGGATAAAGTTGMAKMTLDQQQQIEALKKEIETLEKEIKKSESKPTQPIQPPTQKAKQSRTTNFLVTQALPLRQQDVLDNEELLGSMNITLIKKILELTQELTEANKSKHEFERLYTEANKSKHEFERLYYAIHNFLKRTVIRYKREIKILKIRIKVIADDKDKIINDLIRDISTLSLEIGELNTKFPIELMISLAEKEQLKTKIELLKIQSALKTQSAEERAHTAEVQVDTMQNKISELEENIPNIIDKEMEPFEKQLLELEEQLRIKEKHSYELEEQLTITEELFLKIIGEKVNLEMQIEEYKKFTEADTAQLLTEMEECLGS